MPKHINNERGLTLIELLGAIAITTIVIAVAIALFTGVSDFVFSNGEGRKAKNDAKYALAQISARLHDSKEVFKPNNGNELRYSTFTNGEEAYKAICYLGTELWLFDFNTGSPELTTSKWKEPEINISRSSDTAYYQNGLKLAVDIENAPAYLEGGTNIPIIGESGIGKRIDIILSYKSTRKTAIGGSIQGTIQTVKTSVKLYKY